MTTNMAKLYIDLKKRTMNILSVHGPDRPLLHPPPPPGTYETYFMFSPGTYLNMKSGCNQHQIGMNYLWDAIFKIATIEICQITFSPITLFL